MKNKLKPIFYMCAGVVLAQIFVQRLPPKPESSSVQFDSATRSQQRESALRNELAGMTALVAKAGIAFFDQAKWDAKMEELREARADLVRRGENPLGPSGGEMLLMQGNTISQIPPFNKEEVEKWRAAHPAEEQKAQEVIAQEKKTTEAKSAAAVDSDSAKKDEEKSDESQSDNPSMSATDTPAPVEPKEAE